LNPRQTQGGMEGVHTEGQPAGDVGHYTARRTVSMGQQSLSGIKRVSAWEVGSG
jgi:hypothetical protein